MEEIVDYIESVGIENIKHNNIIKFKKNFDNMKGRTLTERLYLWYYSIDDIPICSICCVNEKSFLNFQKGYRLTCSRKCTRQHPVFKENLSNSLKNSEKAKLQRSERSKKGAAALLNKIKLDDEFKNDIYKKQKESRNQTILSKYGVCNVMQVKNIAEKNHKKMRETNILNKRWLNYDDIGDDFAIYRKKVEYITSKQNINVLENIEKRAHISTPGAFHLDHMYSIKQGFIDCIPVWIIGDICNLEMISGKDNLSKQEKCSITKEELYDAFYK